MDWAVQEELDIVALQEVHVDIHDKPALSRKAKERGYRIFFGHRDLDTCGSVTRG